MKTLLRKVALILCLTAIATACDKEENPPVPEREMGFIERIVSKKYWKEDVHFLYQRYKTDDASIYMDPSDIVHAYRGHGGYTYSNQVLLDAIYIEREGSVLRFVQDEGEYIGYYRNNFAIEYNERDESVRILTPHDSLDYMGAVAGSEMRLKYISEDSVVFDAPIKPFIWQNWQLGDRNLYGSNFVGIRIIWKRLDPNHFNWVDQLD